ncbi:MAG TPA: prepilin peptidase [Candidatus Sulfotelmatobacter sp.]|jgi:prepilin signal peptidase PulO-like enzyme (type II secretory pathway)|nr:prepilin peptidase [Candidatus Sulfotelmatobacter sp.]
MIAGTDWQAVSVMLVLGLIFGSFAGAASWRLPRRITLFGRSACPHCHAVLSVLDLVPLISWLARKGRCRHCGAVVSPRYAIIETATALLFAVSWLAADGDPAVAALLAGVCTLSVVIIAADLEARIIPDAALLPLLALAVVWHYLQGDGYVDGLAAGALALAAAAALQWGYRALRGFDGLGTGDVKFLGVAGCYLGMFGTAGFLIEAGLLGLLFGLGWRLAGKGAAFPFAPALVVALLAGLIWPPLLALPLELMR